MALPLAVVLTATIVGLITAGCGGELKPAVARPRVAVPSTSGYVGRPVLASAEASDFTLDDQHGRPIQLAAQHGKLVLVTFLYTSCPDVCPLIAENVNRALRSLGPGRDHVSVLAVSVDPVHDTRLAVRRFVAGHHLVPEFHYLTGSAAELKPIWQDYNLLIEVRNVERIAHSTYVLLVDRAGRPRFYYPSDVTAFALKHDLGLMLKARAHRRPPTTAPGAP